MSRTGSIFYGELSDVWVERRPGSRLGGRPTLVLEIEDDGRLRIAPLQGTGVLHELAEALAAARGKAAS